MTTEERKTPEPSDDHALDFELPSPPAVGAGKLVAIGATVALGLAVVFAVTFALRRKEHAELIRSSHDLAAGHLHVDVITPKVMSSDRALTLPGTIDPVAETTLYPQANGYVRKFNVDIGDTVKEGQVLAEIDTPEIDQQLQQAQAQLQQTQAQVTQAQANAALSQADLARYKQLTPAGVTSEAELDQKRAQADVSSANVAVANAAVTAQRASIGRLSQMKNFARVVAPFDGKVTKRWAEKGALVTTGNGTPLFRVAALDPARVFIHVPQDVVPGMKNDAVAKVSIREYPGRTFDGKVARTSGELDEASRTMIVEVRVPNPKSELVPGMYANVAISLPVAHRVLEVPATAMVSDARGTFVAVVTKDAGEDVVHLVKVTLERDTGATLQISAGLKEDDRVVKNASSQLTDGLTVDVGVAPAPSATAPSASATGSAAAK